jgi:hypothetical protein
VARATRRLEAFAHAINHTNPTAASASPARVLTSPRRFVFRSSMFQVEASSW